MVINLFLIGIVVALAVIACRAIIWCWVMPVANDGKEPWFAFIALGVVAAIAGLLMAVAGFYTSECFHNWELVGVTGYQVIKYCVLRAIENVGRVGTVLVFGFPLAIAGSYVASVMARWSNFGAGGDEE